MKDLKLFFMILLLLTFGSIYAHKDRGEYPKSIKFIFFDKEVLDLSYDDFDVGSERFYDVFPNVQLFFKKQVFSNAEVWKQISKNGRQGGKL